MELLQAEASAKSRITPRDSLQAVSKVMVSTVCYQQPCCGRLESIDPFAKDCDVRKPAMKHLISGINLRSQIYLERAVNVILLGRQCKFDVTKRP